MGQAHPRATGWSTWCGLAGARHGCDTGPHPATSEGWSAPKVAQALDVKYAKRRFSKDGLDGVLQDRPQANRYRKLPGRGPSHRPDLYPGSRRA